MEIKRRQYDSSSVEKIEKVELETFIKEMVSILNSRFSKIEREINNLKVDVSSMSGYGSTITKLRNDIALIRTDIASLRSGSKPTLDKKTLNSLKK